MAGRAELRGKLTLLLGVVAAELGLLASAVVVELLVVFAAAALLEVGELAGLFRAAVAVPKELATNADARVAVLFEVFVCGWAEFDVNSRGMS